MIRILLMIRLRSLFYGMFGRSLNAKKRGPVFKLLIGLLVIYIIAAFFYVFVTLFDALCAPFAAAGLGWFYFALAGIIVFFFCFIASIFMTQAQIFDAKDNDLLLSMPVKPSAVLASRIAILLIMNYLYEAFVILPAGIIWFLNQPVTAAGVVFFILSALLLPMLALAVSCFFGWLMALLAARLRRKNIMTMIASVAFLLAYFWLYSRISDYVNQLIANGALIAAAIEKAVFPAYHLGVAIAEGSALSMLFFALCALVPFGIAYALLARYFIRIVTSNRGTAKIKYREKALKVSGIRMAFVKKELRHFIASPMYILNATMGAIFMLILAGILIVKSEMITNFVASMPQLNFSLPTLFAAALCVLSGTNFVSAPSISLEGSNLWIAQSLPVSPFDVLWSKVLLHIVVCIPFVVVSAVISAVALRATAAQTALLLLLPTSFTVFVALFGVVINLRFPKFDWISETHAVKQSISTVVTMFGSIAVFVLLAVVYFAFLSGLTTLEFYLALITVLFVVLSMILYRYLKTGGSKLFEAL